MKKLCNSCGNEKELSEFQKRGDGKGVRQPCRQCISDRRAGRPISLTLQSVSKPEKVKIPIEAESFPLSDLAESEISLLEKIREKHNRHFSLSVAKDGKARLQIHGNPDVSYRGGNIIEVLTMAL